MAETTLPSAQDIQGARVYMVRGFHKCVVHRLTTPEQWRECADELERYLNALDYAESCRTAAEACEQAPGGEALTGPNREPITDQTWVRWLLDKPLHQRRRLVRMALGEEVEVPTETNRA